MTKPIVNFLLFQLGWLLSVLASAKGYPWLGVIYAVIWCYLHLRHYELNTNSELMLILFSAALGFTVDSLLVLSGVMSFPEHARLGYPSSLWMVGLWVMFAMTLRHSLQWLADKSWLAVALGLAFGPLAYWAGYRLGAIEIRSDTISILFISLAWGFSMFCLNYFESWSRTRILRLSS